MIAFLAGMLLAASAFAQSPQAVPALHARVTDLTGTLSSEQTAQLESQLQSIEQRKGAQVAVLVVKTTQPEAIEDYSIRVAEAWKLGRGKVDGKKVDDGVLILVAKDDRKVRIEVGYGLEGAIPDAIARRIIAEAIAPAFRKGDFYGGLKAAVDDVGKLIEGEALPPVWQPGHEADGSDPGDWVIGVLVVLMVGMFATLIIGRILGPMAGGVAAGVFSMFNGAGAIMAGVAGVGAFVVLLAIASTMGSAMRSAGGGRGGGRHGGGPPVWGGGGSSSGGWSSGSSDSGGFSGGGGDFGGGGASGDW